MFTFGDNARERVEVLGDPRGFFPGPQRQVEVIRLVVCLYE